MSVQNEVFNATHTGILNINGVKANVAILDNGERVISVKSTTEVFNATYHTTKTNIPEFLTHSYVKKYLTEELMVLLHRKIAYIDLHGNKHYSYNVEVLQHIADMFGEIEFNNEMNTSVRQRIAEQARYISAMGFIVGFNAIVDEQLTGKKPKVTKEDEFNTVKHINRHRPINDSGYIPVSPNRKVKAEGIATFGDVKVDVAILDTDLRVISARAIFKLVGVPYKANMVDGLPAFVSAKYLQPFITTTLDDMLTNRIWYTSKSGTKKMGYDVSLIIHVFRVYTRAYLAGAFKNKKVAMKRYIKMKLLFRSISVLGLMKLVEEAVGYNRIPTETFGLTLKGLLDTRRRYYPTVFKAPFYKEVFRLLKLEGDYMEYKKPDIVADFTTDVVYNTLSDNLGKHLANIRVQLKDNKLIPKPPLYSYLSDYGINNFIKHVDVITNIMKESKDIKELVSKLESIDNITKDRLHLLYDFIV